MQQSPILLGVNIDHIATLRQARLTEYPNIIDAALLAEKSGADSITIHLREDRRHIQDNDVITLSNTITSKMNLEMAASTEIINIACDIAPKDCCIVPEKRAELTTEGGLDVLSQQSHLKKVCQKLADNNIRVSLFIDADKQQIDACYKIGVPVIELHTGHYADAKTSTEKQKELNKIIAGSSYAHNLGLQVNAGHGLHLQNTKEIASIKEIVELNIGHSIISRAVFVGLSKAVIEMKQLIITARL